MNAFGLAAEAVTEEPNPELIAALREGVADMRAGRLLTREEADAEFDAAFADARVRVRKHLSGAESAGRHD